MHTANDFQQRMQRIEGLIHRLETAADSETRNCALELMQSLMMEKYYPNSAWLCLRRDVSDRLYRYKLRRGLPTFEATLESLLPTDQEPLPTDGEEMIH